jgi:hypothetical protein
MPNQNQQQFYSSLSASVPGASSYGSYGQSPANHDMNMVSGSMMSQDNGEGGDKRR